MEQKEINSYLRKIRSRIKYMNSHPEMYETANKYTHCLYVNNYFDVKQKTILGFKIIKSDMLSSDEYFYFGYKTR
jgi:hypothetical protein